MSKIKAEQEQKERIKIICPACNRTDYYKVKPNYCGFCGINLQNEQIKGGK